MSSVEQRAAAAEGHLRAGRFSQAGVLYKEILEENPTHLESLHGLGLASLDTGQVDTAIEMLSTAVAIAPSHAPILANLALAYDAAGKLEDAETCFERSLALDPDLPVANLNFIRLLIRRNRPQQALARAKALVERAPDFAEAHGIMGLLFLQQRSLAAARLCLERAVELDPGYTEGWKLLGVLMSEANQLDDARRNLETALLNSPGNPEIQMLLADVLVGLGQDDAVEARIKKAGALAGKSPRFMTAEARIRLRQGQPAVALAAATKALRTAPDDAEATRILALALAAQGQTDAAQKTADRLGELQDGGRAGILLKATFKLLATAYGEGFELLHAGVSGKGNFWAEPLSAANLSGKQIGLQAPEQVGVAARYLRYLPRLSEAGASLRIFADGEVLDMLLALDLPCPVRPVSEALSEPADLTASMERLPYLLKEDGSPDGFRAVKPLPDDAASSVREALDALPRPLIALGIPQSDDNGSDPAWVLRSTSRIDAWLASNSGSAVLLGGGDWSGTALVTSLADLGLDSDIGTVIAVLSLSDMFAGPAAWPAEVAGALGLGGTVFVPCTPDWVWSVNGSSTPWYPSLQLDREAPNASITGALAQN